MKHFLIFFLLFSGKTYAQQWQVVAATDSMQVGSIHVFNDYLFVSYIGTWDGSSSSNAFERLDLNNSYQSLQMEDVNGQPFISNNVGFLGTVNGQIFGLDYQTVITSGDNGLSWTETSTFNNFPIRLLGSGGNLYIGVYRTLYQSQDIGATFDLIYDEGYYVNTSMKPLLEYNGDVYSSEAAGLLRNHLVINPKEFSQITNIGNVLYGIAEYDNLYKSVDSGNTWTLVNDHPFDYTYINRLVNHNGVLYACTNGKGIHVSTDQGAHFFDISNGLPIVVKDIGFHNENAYVSTPIGVYVTSETGFLSNLGDPELYPNDFPCVYPNPSEGTFYISGLQAKDLKIFDELGREIPVGCVYKNDRVEITLNSQFQGCFTVHYVNDQNQVIVKKIVLRN